MRRGFPPIPWITGILLPLLGVALAGCAGAPAAVGQAAQPSGYGYMCSAGFYSCQLGAQYPVGSQCTCPGLGAPSFGVVK